ncbi:Serine/threonine-protein phosphatase 2B catalytic subunit alpha, partial [Perkinsus olseni]
NASIHLAARLHHHMMTEAAEGREGDGTKNEAEEETPEERADRLRKKIKTVGGGERRVSRMMLMFKTLREENETIISLKGVCPGHRLAPGLLLSGRDALKNELEKFTEARSMDLENERMPSDEKETNPSGWWAVLALEGSLLGGTTLAADTRSHAAATLRGERRQPKPSL